MTRIRKRKPGVASVLVRGRSSQAMPPEQKKANKPKRSGRTTVLAGLLAVIAVLAAWLSNCIPGFGFGGGKGEGDAEQAGESEPAKPAEREVEPASSKADDAKQPEVGTSEPVPLKLTIDARGSCTFADGDAVECASVCDRDELFEGAESVIIDAKNASQSVVVDVLECLKGKKLAVSIQRN